jgi:hypothetical protein
MKRLKKGKGGNKQKEVIKTSNPSHCLVGIKDHTLEIKVGLGLHVVNGGGDQVSCQWNVKDGRCITHRQSHKGPTN